MISNPRYELQKTKVPKFNKPDIKLLCCNIHEFLDIVDGIFALTQGATRFEYYQQTLGGLLRDTWDAIVTAGDLTTGAVWPVSVAGFHDCLNVFITWYIHDTDLEDMCLFLDRSKIPYATTCVELSSHLCFVNQLMWFFPGANNITPFSEACLKLIFVNMMRVKFQAQFAISGSCITDDTFSLDQLVDYMTILEEASQA